MNEVNVVCAVIIEDNKVFMCQRPKGKSLEDYFEFPGGKIEQGETQEKALIREIGEELNASIKILELFKCVKYDYVGITNCPDFTLNMSAYLCEFKTPFKLVEHQSFVWCTKDELDNLLIPPADKDIITKLKEEILK